MTKIKTTDTLTNEQLLKMKVFAEKGNLALHKIQCREDHMNEFEMAFPILSFTSYKSEGGLALLGVKLTRHGVGYLIKQLQNFQKGLDVE